MAPYRIRLLLLILPFALPVLLPGCQSSQPAASDRAVDTRGATRMEDRLADSDAERAKQALERNQRAGERRPAAPERPPAVDQPRLPK